MLYEQYLKSDHWKNTRNKKIDRIDHCQVCFSKDKLHVHHKHYKKNDESILFREQDGDLLVLCASCHRLWHHYIGLKTLRHKHFSKLRRLVRMGVTTQKAFWIFTQQPKLYELIYAKYSYKLESAQQASI